ncbi:hypothetical protein CEW89_09715 [Celeribacter ethanolicus]|uniref:Uncharacterized protein n=1 Tax=Celeribacter ethanolicus TaxID=1758178 RepID=A0A291GC87_9RHOB|nr:hypothetical protein CEW89_09715 [Celeribacter ethanolicus]
MRGKTGGFWIEQRSLEVQTMLNMGVLMVRKALVAAELMFETGRSGRNNCTAFPEKPHPASWETPGFQ